jgi:acetyltransferase-like isoleucine patch superfamily enzyme
LRTALGWARARLSELRTRAQIQLALKRRGSRVPFFFKGDPWPFREGGGVQIGRGVFVGSGAWFSVGPGARLTIGDNAHINRGFVLACVGNVAIGRNVVMADRVFIGDTNHGYADVSTPIILQPMAPPRPVVVEDDCWLGIGVCVLSGVTIGRHSVIGANSVVTRDVPPFSVACGNPAVVVKQYDWTRKQWVRTGPTAPGESVWTAGESGA